MVVRLLSLRWIRPVNRWVSQVVFSESISEVSESVSLQKKLPGIKPESMSASWAFEEIFVEWIRLQKKLLHRFQNLSMSYIWIRRNVYFLSEDFHHFPNQLVHLSQKRRFIKRVSFQKKLLLQWVSCTSSSLTRICSLWISILSEIALRRSFRFIEGAQTIIWVSKSIRISKCADRIWNQLQSRLNQLQHQ